MKETTEIQFILQYYIVHPLQTNEHPLVPPIGRNRESFYKFVLMPNNR